jgi:hypothetical protein
LRRPSTNSVSKARALSLSASRQPESAARSHTPSIMAAIMAARFRASSGGTSLFRAAQIRQHAPLIGRLHPLQGLTCSTWPQKASHAVPVRCRTPRRQIRVDDRLDSAARRAHLSRKRART